MFILYLSNKKNEQRFIITNLSSYIITYFIIKKYDTKFNIELYIICTHSKSIANDIHTGWTTMIFSAISELRKVT
ncbi:hypothetical protein OBPA_28010 [Polaribacter sp. OB-PA-B3]